MFGLKKEDKKPFFEFDLQKEIKDDKKQKVLKDKADKQILAIKAQLRAGADPQSFEQLGVLMHGYSALLKILSDVTPNK